MRKRDVIAQWIASLPLSDIVAWRCPTSAELEGLPLEPLRPDPGDQWIFDRFCATYVEQWYKESLLREWRYLHAGEIAPCPPEVMRTRYVDPAALSCEIANRSAQQ